MMRKKNMVLILVLSSLFFMSCTDFKTNLNYNNPAKLAALAAAQEDALPSSEQIDFQFIKEKILDTNCINCHTGKHNNYDQYGIIKLAANDILTRIKSTSFFNRMPKGRDPLPEELILLFEAWVNQGAPEFANIDNKSPDQQIINYNFSDIKELVLGPNQCLKCHTKFEDYGVVVNNINKIIGSIENGEMPPSFGVQNYRPVSEEEFNVLLMWIDLEMPEF